MALKLSTPPPSPAAQPPGSSGLFPRSAPPPRAPGARAPHRAVGRVLGALDEMGLADNTLVVFTSDNGQMPGASVADPLRAAKGYLYEGGIRVPMMLRWPGRVRAGASARGIAL